MPPALKWPALAAAISSEVSASLALRAAVDHPAWYTLVVAGYSLSFVLISVVLRLGMPIGVAYGIWAATGVALTALLAALLFDDPLTWMMGAGFVAIIGGVLMIELGSRQESTP
ncbi:QacE family quaternary ammonium compound efflux SMR transporter [Paractinoplanes abujensis]|uniref:Spermidine export protein MdtJ n=1 Tax=Paractinoplanes abujensis TaxID=882441 RepID=A0A7W7G139_9ACTN|nr:SMR family transporter [Actinoplanes abujensis]MBB4691795.1 small multidrug resistance pump [Actinoplanes abujensis]GID16783.1 QacE family quaternary ammonium compound efflux SMR transporter [Actinoplanes abujensis]